MPITPLKVKFKKLHPAAKVPVYKSAEAAGCDIYTVVEETIKPGEIAFLKSGLAIEIPQGYFAAMTPRASFCLKQHLDMPHSLGIMDSDYRGEYLIPLRNLGSEPVEIPAGERIAQMIFLPYVQAQFEESTELSDTIRGAGGFGSTGKN